MKLLCRLGLHKFSWHFTAEGWDPDTFVYACERCGLEKE